MRHPVCAMPARAGARLCAALLALMCTLSCAQAAPLSSELARNAALPRAPLLDPGLFDRPERLREVRLAPDGAHLAWVEDSDGKPVLYVKPLAGGAARSLVALESNDRGAPARVHWSRDGTVLFLAQEGGVAAIGVRDGAGGLIASFGKDGKDGNARFAGVDRAMP
ncbi:hypothetical protein [Massilia sp. LC238]|uniref:TolB family protein n=1 Tax=Massilia sp. LC238 TaxID=1502852 RepID=UPI0004E372D4|nr:hypothetical protein [Massilia sp. LC238]KFC65583.1 hypothetical protein FG94_03666 [Massilia sp. LC238]